MKILILFLTFFFILLHQVFAANSDSGHFVWSSLPDLPQAVSGQFVGVSNNALIIAGGSYFPISPFYGGSKNWLNTIYVLASAGDEWKGAGRMTLPVAYGATVDLEGGVLCIGGSDAQQMHQTVVKLKWKDDRIHQKAFPGLPMRSAMSGAAKLGNKIYVAGGQDSYTATSALKNFWCLDLDKIEAGWQELPPWPGPGRILPVMEGQDNAIYLISGCELVKTIEGKVTRNYLTDAFRYIPTKGWETIAEVPRPVAAAPSVTFNQTYILVFGGDDGALATKVQTLKDNHPGFSHDVLSYHTITDTWQVVDQSPASVVTTKSALFNEAIILAGGEDRPGHRSQKVYAIELDVKRAQFNTLNFCVLAIYLLTLIIIGVYFSKREKSTDDFFLGGKRIPWWAAGLSIYGTQLSAITFMAIPAKAYITDWVYFLNGLCIVAITPIVVYFYLPHFRRLNITTAYEYLETRFNLPVRLFASMAFILFQFGRMAIVIYLPAIALSTVTSMDIVTSILIMGILCTIYTVLGGIEAVIWTDVLQVVVLLGGAVISLLIIFFSFEGGLRDIIHIGSAHDKFHMFNWTWDYTVTAIWVVLIGNLFSNLIPYTSDQVVIQRYLTTADEKQAKKSIWTNAAITLPTYIIFFGLGTSLFAFYKSHPDLLNINLTNDAIFPWFISQELPAGFSGLVIAGLFAAAMSSLDSSMNSISAALVTDFYRRLKKTVSETACLRLARWLTAVIGAIGTGSALMMVTFQIQSMWDLFFKFLGLIGGSMAGIFALGVFTKKAHGVGALIGALCSTFILYIVQSFTDVHFFLYAAVGIVTCFIIGYLLSLIIPQSQKSKIDLTKT